jgi:hypothetical protein
MKQENQLTPKQMEAAAKVAADLLTDQEIVDSLGIGARTLYRWKNLPAFQAQLKAFRDAHHKQVMKRYLSATDSFL